LGKTIDVMFVTPPSVIASVQAGQLRAIGYTGVKPLAEFPHVPLIRDSLPGFSVPGSWTMVYAPSKTPSAIIERLNAAIRHALSVPTVAGALSRAGYAPDSRSPAETADFFHRQVELAGEAVRAAGIAPN
jgi:tripartite-type tricarboxylate transporter receptor subunit TctC